MKKIQTQGRRKKKTSFLHELFVHRELYLMALPGLLAFFIINYLPMFGVVIAFQDYNPIKGILGSDWNGFKNFEFFFKSQSALNITKNTIMYNVIFIILGIGLGMITAVLISELSFKKLGSLYKSILFLPYLISWVVAAYLLFAFLSTDRGIINKVLTALGQDPVQWYGSPTLWYVILPLAYLWKNVGYFSVIFFAGITGISRDMYEAAAMDGAGKVKQTLYITIPSLMPIVITLVILQFGKIFFAAFGDWGMFYNLPMQSGVLFPATDVIDTYVFNSLRKLNDFGMSTAVGLYQSLVGCILVIASNMLVRKIDKDSAMF